LLCGLLVLMKFNSMRVQYEFGVFFQSYKPGHWWFEVTTMVEKLMLCAILAFFPQNLQAPIGMGVCLVQIVLLLLTSPYIRPDDAVLHLLYDADLMLILGAGYLFDQHNKGTTELWQYGSADTIFWSTVLTCTMLFFIGLAIFMALRKAGFTGRCSPTNYAELKNEDMELPQPLSASVQGSYLIDRLETINGGLDGEEEDIRTAKKLSYEPPTIKLSGAAALSPSRKGTRVGPSADVEMHSITDKQQMMRQGTEGNDENNGMGVLGNDGGDDDDGATPASLYLAKMKQARSNKPNKINLMGRGPSSSYSDSRQPLL